MPRIVNNDQAFFGPIGASGTRVQNIQIQSQTNTILIIMRIIYTGLSENLITATTSLQQAGGPHGLIFFLEGLRTCRDSSG